MKTITKWRIAEAIFLIGAIVSLILMLTTSSRWLILATAFAGMYMVATLAEEEAKKKPKVKYVAVEIDNDYTKWVAEQEYKNLLY